MIAIFFGVGITLLELFTIIRAFLRCLQERFSFGWIAAIVRLALLIGGVIAYVVVTIRSAAAVEATASLPLVFVLAMAMWGGPLTSFVTLWRANHLTKDIPAAQEERLGRPFNAWLPVALIDAVSIVIQLGAFAIGREH